MAILKYKRKLSELVVQELKAVLTKYNPDLDLKPFSKKETLKLQVETHFSSLPTKPLWYTSEPSNPTFYLTANDENREILCIDESEITENLADYDNNRPFN